MQSYWTKDNGQTWTRLDTYVEKCAWGRSSELVMPDETVFCISHQTKTGYQSTLYFNPLDVLRFISFATLSSGYQLKLTGAVGFFIFDKFLAVGVVSAHIS